MSSGSDRDRDEHVEVPGPANEAERQRWNDAAWTSGWVPREQITTSVTDVLLDHLGLAPGESLLDVGSGGGGLSMAAASRVGPTGRVTGVDISVPLVELARSRVTETTLTNVTFVVADAQTDRIDGRPFDVAASQFGVMFFDAPEHAFANIADHVAPGGRLAFACWQRQEDNPWCVSPTLAAFAPPPVTVAAASTGPFAFGDPAMVTRILESSGWSQIQRIPYARNQIVERAALVDDANALASIDESQRPGAARALKDQLSRFDQGNGRFEIPLAFQIFLAHRP